jgi:hypothetical protein
MGLWWPVTFATSSYSLGEGVREVRPRRIDDEGDRRARLTKRLYLYIRLVVVVMVKIREIPIEKYFKW